MKNIILIGMPGCGKTTIGKELAKITNKKFIDTDEEIQKKLGKSIPEIFQQGENYFRKVETQVTEEVSKVQSSVIATGGGIIKNKYNIDMLKENGIIVFIDRPIKNIIHDMDMSNRPLVNVKEKIVKLYEERYCLYKKYADVYVCNNSVIENIIKEIIKKFLINHTNKVE